MAENRARQIVLAGRLQDPAQLSNFHLEELPLPIPGTDEILLKFLYISLDPYMRGRMDDKKSYAASINVGEPNIYAQERTSLETGSGSAFHRLALVEQW
jgi:NADPH-dependent curcumin reductase CurA